MARPKPFGTVGNGVNPTPLHGPKNVCEQLLQFLCRMIDKVRDTSPDLQLLESSGNELTRAGHAPLKKGKHKRRCCCWGFRIRPSPEAKLASQLRALERNLHENDKSQPIQGVSSTSLSTFETTSSSHHHSAESEAEAGPGVRNPAIQRLPSCMGSALGDASTRPDESTPDNMKPSSSLVSPDDIFEFPDILTESEAASGPAAILDHGLPSNLGSSLGHVVSPRPDESKLNCEDKRCTSSLNTLDDDINVSRCTSAEPQTAGQESSVRRVLRFSGSAAVVGSRRPGDAVVPAGVASFASKDAPACPHDTLSDSCVVHIQCLGYGAFGVAMLAEIIKTSEIIVEKCLSKRRLLKNKRELEQAFTEKKALRKASKCRFVVKLLGTSQTSSNLILRLQLCHGGTMWDRMSTYKIDYAFTPYGLSKKEIQFNAACLVSGINELHSLGIVHRDLKPENILYGPDGYLLISDLGLAVHLGPGEVVREGAGTLPYMAPEAVMLWSPRHEHKSPGAGKASDWWSFAIMTFEMSVGRTPFECRHQDGRIDETGTFESIIGERPVPVKDVILSQLSIIWPELYDLLKTLLVADPMERLKGVQNVKQHAFFAGINWEDLEAHKLKAPWVPSKNLSSLPSVNPGNHDALQSHKIEKEDQVKYFGKW